FLLQGRQQPVDRRGREPHAFGDPRQRHAPGGLGELIENAERAHERLNGVGSRTGRAGRLGLFRRAFPKRRRVRTAERIQSRIRMLATPRPWVCARKFWKWPTGALKGRRLSDLARTSITVQRAFDRLSGEAGPAAAGMGASFGWPIASGLAITPRN